MDFNFQAGWAPPASAVAHTGGMLQDNVLLSGKRKPRIFSVLGEATFKKYF